MCLDVEDDERREISDGVRRARKQHECRSCDRTIESGEHYRYWVYVRDDDLITDKMCAHCRATINLGCDISGCAPAWWWDQIHSFDADDGGFVGDVLVNHDLSPADRFRMIRRVAECRRGWRRRDGALYPVPDVPVAI